MTYLLFFIGFGLVVKGADYLVDGASSVAKRFGIPTLVIGLTIIAFGTSAPELVVSVTSALSGSGDLAIGNVIGSNIANILLILGLSSIFYPLVVKKSTVKNEIPLAFLASLLIVVLAGDRFIDYPVVSSLGGEAFSGLSRIDGLVFLSFFLVFLFYTFAISEVKASDKTEVPVTIFPLWQSALMFFAGLLMLFLGGDWVVKGAMLIARNMGISEALIGLTIVAVGTSLPELVTSIVAAYKGDADIAIGNVVGSNIFNVFLVLGASSVVSPLGFSPLILSDSIFALFATFLLFAAIFIGKRGTIERWQGVAFVATYFLYIVILISRG
jgi:cation:H+ antiporter